jgi:hypothetical protein
MLTTTDKSEWHENELEERRRENVGKGTDPTIVRTLYPYKVRVKKVQLYKEIISEGDVMEYARTKHIPGMFPIEAIHFDPHGVKRRFYFNSQEAELLEV